MKIEVSVGESIDKLSILELKIKKIVDLVKCVEIKKEIDALIEVNTYKKMYPLFYKMLMYVNEQIWDMTDAIKRKMDIDLEFAKISNQIFELNQKRFRIKSWFNTLTNSTIKEQKSYALSHCQLIIPDEQTFYSKLAEINYLTMEYDSICIECPFISIVKNIFKTPNIKYDTSSTNTIQLTEFEISATIKPIFEFEPIQYINGGMFGDFIQSLSVINENFYNTGRKGILYISEGHGGDIFRNGLQNTYKDTYDVIIQQNYIMDYKIYTNEFIECNLNKWRQSPILYKQNWYHIYNQTYNIEWGKHKWITVPNNKKWNNTIFINTSTTRPNTLNFKSLYSRYNNLIFISADINQYHSFTQLSGINIPYIKVNTFVELCDMISSCQLFIGSLSAPLAIAHSVHVNRIIGLDNGIDAVHNKNFEQIWNNIKYE